MNLISFSIDCFRSQKVTYTCGVNLFHSFWNFHNLMYIQLYFLNRLFSIIHLKSFCSHIHVFIRCDAIHDFLVTFVDLNPFSFNPVDRKCWRKPSIFAISPMITQVHSFWEYKDMCQKLERIHLTTIATEPTFLTTNN